MPYQTFLDTLSMPRSGIYKRVFRTLTPEETSGAILWGQSMGVALQAFVHTFEVVLRNRIHTTLSRQETETRGPPQDSFAWYDHQQGSRQLQGETFSKVEAILSGKTGVRLPTLPSPDRVIARLPFGVWPNILDAQLPTPKVEVRTFQDVFPHHPKAKRHWSYDTNRKTVVEVLKDVRVWRNRLAHCKPVWSEGWFRSSPTQHWTEVVNRLKGRRVEVLEVLEWMCPRTAEVYRQGYAGRLFDVLATDEAVFAHIQQPLAASAVPNFTVVNPAAFTAYKARP
jgi:hypothetical protein